MCHSTTMISMRSTVRKNRFSFELVIIAMIRGISSNERIWWRRSRILMTNSQREYETLSVVTMKDQLMEWWWWRAEIFRGICLQNLVEDLIYCGQDHQQKKFRPTAAGNISDTLEHFCPHRNFSPYFSSFFFITDAAVLDIFPPILFVN